MSLWRIRITVPDDPGSRGALSDMLAAQPDVRLRMLPGRTATSATAGEFVVELPRDDSLASVLSALHQISPQVFVSRAPESAPRPGGEAQMPGGRSPAREMPAPRTPAPRTPAPRTPGPRMPGLRMPGPRTPGQ